MKLTSRTLPLTGGRRCRLGQGRFAVYFLLLIFGTERKFSGNRAKRGALVVVKILFLFFLSRLLAFFLFLGLCFLFHGSGADDTERCARLDARKSLPTMPRNLEESKAFNHFWKLNLFSEGQRKTIEEFERCSLVPQDDKHARFASNACRCEIL